MATTFISAKIAKGFTNKISGTSFTIYNTNFNMPAPDIFDDNSLFNITDGMLNAISEQYTFDLTGIPYGHEICMCSSVFTLYGSYSGGVIRLTQVWKKPDGTTIWTNGGLQTVPTMGGGEQYSYQYVSNQGTAPWEIDVSGTYTVESTIEAVSGDTFTPQTITTNVTFNNVAAFPGYINSQGAVWIEGEQLAYIGDNRFKHLITGVGTTNVGTSGAGAIWISDTDEYLYWVTATGIKKRVPWALKQFSSAFANGPPGAISGQTAGYIWTEGEFGYTHLSYIDKDGDKRLIGDGNDPSL